MLESVSMNGPFVNIGTVCRERGWALFVCSIQGALFLVEGADRCLNMIGWLWPACIASDLMVIYAFHVI